MCDLETLGTRPGCVVLAAAFVRFSDGAHASVNISVPDQQNLGLEIDPATQAWWSNQDAAALALATQNPVPLVSALDYITTWLEWAAAGGDWLIWCHGATFDCPILAELYRRVGREAPWKFWNIRDTRTLYDLAGVDLKAFAVPPPHVALNDAIGQTNAANEALRRIAAVRAAAA